MLGSFQRLLSVVHVVEEPSADAQALGFVVELVKHLFKVVRLKGQVAIHLRHELPIRAGECVKPSVESFDDARTPFAKSAVCRDEPNESTNSPEQPLR